MDIANETDQTSHWKIPGSREDYPDDSRALENPRNRCGAPEQEPGSYLRLDVTCSECLEPRTQGSKPNREAD